MEKKYEGSAAAGEPEAGGTHEIKKEARRLYRATDRYALRKFLDEYLLIPVHSLEQAETQMGILNPMGQFLWELLQQEQTLGDLVSGVTESFDVTPEEAEEDIKTFLEQLEGNHFLEIKEVE